MTSPRLVLDTNVLLSAMLFHQSSVTWLHDAWQSDVIRPLASRETIEQLIRVLAYPKFKLTDMDREELLNDYLPWCETVAVPKKIKVPDCRDPFDRPFMALAVAARADALVTGDKDLLELVGDFEIPVMTPAALKERLNDNSKNKAGWDLF